MKHIPRPTSGAVQEVMQVKEHRLVQALFDTAQAFGKRGCRLPWICVSESEWKMLYNEAATGGFLEQGAIVSGGYPAFYVAGVKIMCVPDNQLTIEGTAQPRQVPQW